MVCLVRWFHTDLVFREFEGKSWDVNAHPSPQVRDCRLNGLLDLTQESDYVRGKLVDYMNKLIDMGVAGFRVDACKHMWPDALSAIFERLHNLKTEWFPADSKPFIYQEVLRNFSYLKSSFLGFHIQYILHLLKC